MEDEPLSLGPYHIKYNLDTDRYEVILTRTGEVEGDEETEQRALVEMQRLHNFDELLGLV